MRTPFVQIEVNNSNSTSLVIKKPNLEYVLWKHVVKLFVNWFFMSSIYKNLLIVMSNCKFSSKMWNMLENKFIVKSRSHMLHIRNSLQNTKKDNLSISDYVLQMK